MTEPGAVLDFVAQKSAKRDEEQKRILQLKQRLDALKKDSANEKLTKEELMELHKKCESILSLARRIADSIEEKIVSDRTELNSLKQQMENTINTSSAAEVQSLTARVNDLQKENEALKDRCNALSKNNSEEENWKNKYETEKKRANEIENKLKTETKSRDSLPNAECQIENDLLDVSKVKKLIRNRFF